MRYILLILIFMSGLGQNIFAQRLNFGNQINSHVFRFSDTFETVGLEDALDYNSKRSKYKFSFRVSYDHLKNSLIAVDGSTDIKIINYAESLDTLALGGSWLFGKTKNFLINFDIPIHAVKLSQDGADITGGDLNRTTALGDSVFSFKWRITRKTASWNLAIMPRLILPLGSDQYLVSDGLSHGLRVLTSKRFGILKLYNHLGYANSPDAGFLNIRREKRIEFGLGVSLDLAKRFAMNFELYGDRVLGGEIGDKQDLINLIAGLRFSTSKANFFAGLNVSGLNNLESQEIGLYAGLKTVFGTQDHKKPLVSRSKNKKKVKLLRRQRKAVKRPKMIKLASRALFQFNESYLSARAKRTLARAAKIIRKHNNMIDKITVVGHTDSVGSYWYNIYLSIRRASAVRAELIRNGVNPKIIFASGAGESKPIVSPELTEDDRQKNRRAEFYFKLKVKNTNTKK